MYELKKMQDVFFNSARQGLKCKIYLILLNLQNLKFVILFSLKTK